MPEEVVDVVEKPKDKDKKKSKKIRSIIEWVISGVLVGAALILIGFRIYQKKTNTSIFGVQYPIVLTDSMEPDYKVNDVLVVKKVDVSTLKVGDDITFYWDLTGKGDVYPMTHRILFINYFENAEDNEGYHYNIGTHGINTHSNQCGVPEGCDITWQTQLLHEDVIIGKVARKSFVLKAMTSVWGLIVLILAPCLYIMITSVWDMFKKIDEQDKLVEAEVSTNGEVKSNPLAGLSKDEIEQLKKEMMEEILNKGKK
jgi:signal peptidase I